MCALCLVSRNARRLMIGSKREGGKGLVCPCIVQSMYLSVRRVGFTRIRLQYTRRLYVRLDFLPGRLLPTVLCQAELARVSFEYPSRGPVTCIRIVRMLYSSVDRVNCNQPSLGKSNSLLRCSSTLNQPVACHVRPCRLYPVPIQCMSPFDLFACGVNSNSHLTR